jgi:glucosylceramidase
VTINTDNEFQTMEGFGGAFTDSATLNIKKLSEKSQDNLLRYNYIFY